MKILAADDQALALEMLVDSIREVKPDAGAVNSYISIIGQSLFSKMRKGKYL